MMQVMTRIDQSQLILTENLNTYPMLVRQLCTSLFILQH